MSAELDTYVRRMSDLVLYTADDVLSTFYLTLLRTELPELQEMSPELLGAVLERREPYLSRAEERMISAPGLVDGFDELLAGGDTR